MNYLDFLQTALPSFTVTDESNYNYNGSGTVLVIKYLSGNIFKDSTVVPVQLSVYTDDLNAAKTTIDTFAKAYNNVPFYEDLEYVVQFYSTPFVLTQFQQQGINYNSQLIVSGTLIKSSNVSEIKEVKIDGYTYETSSRNLAYVTVTDTQRLNTQSISSTNIKSAMLKFTCTMVNKNNDICNKVRRLRTGVLDKDTTFTIVLTYTDNNTTETYSMKLDSTTLNSENTALPAITLSFIV